VVATSHFPKGTGLLVNDKEYHVHIQDEEQWVPVKEDVAVGVLLSFLKRRDPKARDRLLEDKVPDDVREAMRHVVVQFGKSREAEANAYALTTLCMEWNR